MDFLNMDWSDSSNSGSPNAKTLIFTRHVNQFWVGMMSKGLGHQGQQRKMPKFTFEVGRVSQCSRKVAWLCSYAWLTSLSTSTVIWKTICNLKPWLQSQLITIDIQVTGSVGEGPKPRPKTTKDPRLGVKENLWTHIGVARNEYPIDPYQMRTSEETTIGHKVSLAVHWKTVHCLTERIRFSKKTLEFVGQLPPWLFAWGSFVIDTPQNRERE